MSANDMDMESDGWSSDSTPLPPLPELVGAEAFEEAAESFTASRSPWVEGKRDRSFRRQSPDRNTNALMPAWPGVEAAGFASGRASAEKGAGSAETRGSVLGAPDALEAPGARPAFGAGEPTRAFRSRGSAQRSAVLSALRDLPDQTSARRESVSPSNRQPLNGELLDVAGLSLHQEGSASPMASRPRRDPYK